MKRKGKNIKPVLKKEKKVKIKKAPKPIFTDTTETQYEEFDIITYLTDRYAIINKEGRIIDCAQGYGYKSITAAVKCANYKISTGMKFDFENKEEIK